VAAFLTPMFDRSLASPTGLAAIMCVNLAWLGLLSSRDDRRTIVATGLLALLMPAQMLAIVVLTAWAAMLQARALGRKPAPRALTSAAIVAVVTLGVAAAANDWKLREAVACSMPFVQGRPRNLSQLRMVLTGGGALALGLAALGAFSHLDRLWRPAAWWPIGLVVLPLLNGSVDQAAVSPLWAGWWILVALGISDLLRQTGSGRARTAGGLLVLVLLLLLQWQRFTQRQPVEAVKDYGHANLSRAALWELLRALPQATLVSEDASVELLLDATTPRLAATGKPLRVVEPFPADLDAAMKSGPVFALPRGQLRLRDRGVEFVSAGSQLTGVAEVRAVLPCAGVSRAWTEAASLSGRDRLAFVADEASARGPITIYVGSDQPFTAAPAGWPPRTTRGFTLRTYTRAERPDLPDALRAEGLPSSNLLIELPFVARIVMWRTPDAPLVLPVQLTTLARSVVIKADVGSGHESIQLCPSTPWMPDTMPAH
jgi:hypothetical protein